MSRSPLNTATIHPLLHQLSALDALQRTGKPTDAILEQEARGQTELLQSDVLPTIINSPKGFDVKAKLIELGFKFGNQIEGDPLFQEVTLPEGWKKVSDGSEMWSKVVDGQGRERISIFYKAAFYDRKAFMNVIIDPT